MAAMNIRQLSVRMRRYGPVRFLESRTYTSVPVSATSTQFPFRLAELLRHTIGNRPGSAKAGLGSARLAGVGVGRLDASDAWLTRLVEIAVAIGVAVVAGCLADFVLAFAGGRLGRRRWIGVDDRSRS